MRANRFAKIRADDASTRHPITALPLVTFSLLHDVPHAISTRHGGVSGGPYAALNLGSATQDLPENVAENQRRFRDAAAPDGQVFRASLVHGADVAVFRGDDPAAWPLSATGDEPRVRPADGVISDVPGLYVQMTFADCVPLLFADRARGVVGGAHAGWRGTAAGVGPNVVRAMTATFGSRPSDIVAAIGPSIGPCCYEVGPDVERVFREHGTAPVMVRGGDRDYLDLWASNREQLRRAGLPDENIECSSLCTACHVDTFFSHRAEAGRTGRFALCIGLPA